MMQFLDENPNVISWGSEEFKIKYYHPIKKKTVNYIPDFIVKYRDSRGQVITEVLEIKPAKQSSVQNKMSMYDQVQLVINHAKWTAAKALCDAAGIRFRVLTENDLFRQPVKKPRRRVK